MLGHVAEPGVYSAAAAAGGPDEEKLDNADTVCFQLQYITGQDSLHSPGSAL